jgi:hypothetical protein
MEVGGLLARKRVVGWAAFRMQAKHGDLGCLPFDAWPPTPAERERHARALAARADEHARARHLVEEIVDEERSKGTGPAHAASVRQLLVCLEQDEFLHGALLAAAGLRPGDEVPERRGVPVGLAS